MIFDIRDYGAVGDGKTMNTVAIQTAIRECAAAGGGRVEVREGHYMTGSIQLLSNVELHLAANSSLMGSPDYADYPEWTEAKHVNLPMLPRERSACLIFADEAENIAITGPGTIDANGDIYVIPDPDGQQWGHKRIDGLTPPRVVFFAGCRNVTVTDVTMVRQPAGWSYWVSDCDYVTFDKLKIIANVDYPNNDGIHINSSRNVTVSNCCITCGDDCLVVRANNSSLAENKVCEKVTVTNCNLTSHSGGIRIGWIKDGTIRNCTFSNLVMTDCAVGISILIPGRGDTRISDEGRESTLIENMIFSNIIMDRGYSSPVYIHMHDNPHNPCTAIRNLYFSGIHATTYERLHIIGKPDLPVQNVRFSDCSFTQLDPATLDTSHCHGAKALWGGSVPGDCHITSPHMLMHTENIVFNNTSFSTR